MGEIELGNHFLYLNLFNCVQTKDSCKNELALHGII